MKKIAVRFSLLTCLFLLLHQMSFANPSSETFLTLNIIHTAKLGTAEVHTFFVRAEENEYFEIICERKGADSGLSVFSPSNSLISLSNAPGGFADNDSLIFVAETSGNYKIEIKSRRPGKFVGEYKIYLKEKRPATKTDRIRAEAMRLTGLSRYTVRGWENRIQKAETALEDQKKSLELFEKIGDLRGQAIALFHIADIYSNEFGLEPKAIEYFEKAVPLWEKLDEPANLATCLTGLANEYRMRGLNEKSEEMFNRAVAINRSINNFHGVAATNSLFCRLYNDTGFFQKGFEKCRESLKFTKDADPLTDSYTYHALAALSGNSGDYGNDEKYIYKALERVNSVNDIVNPIRFARIKAGIGGFFYAKKDYEKAIEYYLEAYKISEDVHRPVFSATFLIFLSECHFALKDYEKAVEFGEKSLALIRKYDPRRRQAALNFLAKTYAEIGKTEKAREYFFEAIAANRQNKDRYAEAECLYWLADLEKKSGNLETAHLLLRQAVGNMEIIRADLLGKSQRSSYNSILRIYYESEIDILIKKYERSPQIKYLEEAWQKQEKIRARSLLENFIENGLNVNEIVSEEFFVKEKELLETVATAENERIEAERSKDAEKSRIAEQNLQSALDELQVLQENVRRNNPKFSAINQTKDFSFADVRQTLSENSALLEFSVGEKQTYLWLIKKDSVKLFTLPARAELKRVSLDYYNLLTDKTATATKTVEKSKELSRLLFEPLKNELSDIKTLLIVPDGSLQLIPFATLTLDPDSDFHPLIEQFEIVSFPSFSSFVYLRETKQNAKAEKLLAVIADPIFQFDDERLSRKGKKAVRNKTSTAESDKLAETLRDFGIDRLSRLPFTNIEAKEIQKFAPEDTTLALGENASRQRFLNGDFENYKILHFATHGFLNQKNPDLSGLVLSLFDKKRQSQNGFLRVIDLYSVRLNADLVVLSACQTGLGKDVEGEGIVGLTHGFMYAGASRVVSSLWKVEDAATAELMKNFYREMLVNKQTPAAALRSAQNAMRKINRFQHPRYWAGFTLNGDWQ